MSKGVQSIDLAYWLSFFARKRIYLVCLISPPFCFKPCHLF